MRNKNIRIFTLKIWTDYSNDFGIKFMADSIIQIVAALDNFRKGYHAEIEERKEGMADGESN